MYVPSFEDNPSKRLIQPSVPRFVKGTDPLSTQHAPQFVAFTAGHRSNAKIASIYNSILRSRHRLARATPEG